MSDNKKYYWLKMQYDFFTTKEIKKLRKIAGGDTYTIIYLKMQLKSLKNDCKLYFEGVEDDFAEELALDIDEDVDNVRVTLSFLENRGLIELHNQNGLDEYHLIEAKENTGSETSAAARVRKHRANKKALASNKTVTMCNTELETEKELQLEKDIDKEKKPSSPSPEKPKPDPIQELFKTWVECGMIKHSSAVLKKNIKPSHKKFISDIGVEECKKAVRNYAFILGSPDYFWSCKWDFWDFINRGLSKFLDESRPREKWRQGKSKGKYHSSREDEQRKEYEKHNQLKGGNVGERPPTPEWLKKARALENASQ